MANQQSNQQNRQPGQSQQGQQKQGFNQQPKNKEAENKFRPKAEDDENEPSERGQQNR